MNSISRISIFSASALLALSACGSDSSSQSATDSPTSITNPVPWSLTGMPGPDDAQSRPIVVVKIENDPIVRPQTGLDRADLIFEELVEGGATRFAVAYQSDIPDEVGPVRSVRHVDVAIAEPIADVFVFSGGAKRTMRFVGRKLPTTISVVREGAPGMTRKTGIPAPHNIFLNTKEMFAALAERNSPSSGFFIPKPMPMPSPSASATGSASGTPTTTPAPVGKSVSDVAVTFSSFAGPNWKWNAADKLWMRSEGIKPFNNKDGSQFGTNNLMIIEVREIDAGYKGQTGGYVPRTVLTGSGRAWVLSDGKAIELRWNKPRVAAQMELSDVNGNPFTMPTGRTWVELLPVLTTGKYSFDGVMVPVKNPPIPAAVPDPNDTDAP
jgi:hypothetical protein